MHANLVAKVEVEVEVDIHNWFHPRSTISRLARWHCPLKKEDQANPSRVDFRDLNRACPKDEFPFHMELYIDAQTGMRRYHL